MVDTIKETYRQQIARLVRAMVQTENVCDLAGDLSPESSLAQVTMFVEGNQEKRFEKVQKQLVFLLEAFEDFDRLTAAYLRACPLAAYDSGTSDGQRMLRWLEETQRLSAVQQDYVACQRARHAVEELARKNRLKHVHFQELASLSNTWASRLDTNPQLRVYLNPIRLWIRFLTSELLDDDTTPPTNVLFFAAGSQVSAAVLELEGQALVNELADFGPCTLGEWAALSARFGRDELAETCRDLLKIGLVAVG